MRAGQSSFTLTRLPGSAHLRAVGELDLATLPALRAVVLDEFDRLPVRNLVVDFTDVTFFDVRTLCLLADASVRLGQVGARLTLTGLSDWQQRVVHLAHLDELLAPADDLASQSGEITAATSVLWHAHA